MSDNPNSLISDAICVSSHDHLYQLDKTKPVSVEGRSGKVSVLLIIGVIFAVIIAVALISMFLSGGLEFESMTAAGFFVLFGVAFIVFGIKQQLNFNNKNRAERELLKNCLCTDGVITECDVRRYTRTVGDSDRYYYDVTLTYVFYDDKNIERSNYFKYTYSNDPEFYKGQWLIIAFNGTDSVILNKFTFVKEDEERFIAHEAARSDDDYDGLTDELIENVDMTKPMSSLENNRVMLWLAICLMGVTAIYAVVAGALFVPHFFGEGILALIILGCLLTMLAPAALVTSVIVLLCMYFKRQKRFNKIIKSSPYFTWGKVFFSEKTYGNKNRKKVLYCYIDKWQEKHTEVLKVALTTAMINPRATVIAYTADGKSTPLDRYTLLDEG